MGAHQTKNTSTDVTNLMTSVMQKTVQSCTTEAEAGNAFSVSGSGDVAQNISQKSVITVNANCAANLTKSSDLSNAIQNSITQGLSDSSDFGSGLFSVSSDINTANMQNNISSTVSNTSIETCLNQLDQRNIISVSGANDAIDNVKQDSVGSLMTSCLLKDSQVSDALNGITNAANQHATYKAKGPISDISDALSSLISAPMKMIGVLFIVIICFVILYKLMSSGGSAPHAAAAPSIISNVAAPATAAAVNNIA